MSALTLTDEQRQEIMTQGLEDPPLFLRTFLPHWYTRPLDWAHRGLIAILLRQTDFLLNFGEETWPGGVKYTWTISKLRKIVKFFKWTDGTREVHLFELVEHEDGEFTIDLNIAKNTQVVWPRGFGKTTVINGINILKVVYKLRKFIVYLSETATHAGMQISNIKRELESNEALIEVFGKQKPERNDVEKWRDDFFETLNGVALTGRGRGGQVRGLNHNGVRPDDITIDDVEDKESVETELQRNKTLKWFKADVEPALNQITGEGSITMIGTLLHREALIPKVLGDPDWVSIVFGAIDPEGLPLWEEYMTLEDIQKKKISYTRMGMLSEFYMEFLSQIKNTEASKFHGPFTIVFMKRTDFVGRALALDPAISDDKEKADFCAFAVTGMTEKGQHHVLDVRGRKAMTPREQIDTFFELKILWDTTSQGIEAVAYQKALIHLVREEMFRKSKQYGHKAYFQVLPILHGKTGKILRVEGMLAPRYSAGYISHQRIFPELEQQLLDWPNDKKDFPDVVAMAITLLDPLAGMAFQPEEQLDGEIPRENVLSADMYEPLEQEYFEGAP